MNAFQRQAYKNQIANITSGTLVLVVDFKQDLIICKGQRQRGSSLFSPVHRSVLGFSLYYFDVPTKSVKQKQFVFISSSVNKDATHVPKNCFSIHGL